MRAGNADRLESGWDNSIPVWERYIPQFACPKSHSMVAQVTVTGRLICLRATYYLIAGRAAWRAA